MKCPKCKYEIKPEEIGRPRTFDHEEARRLYSRKGWSLRKVAEKLGVTHGAIQSALKGKKNMKALLFAMLLLQGCAVMEQYGPQRNIHQERQVSWTNKTLPITEANKAQNDCFDRAWKVYPNSMHYLAQAQRGETFERCMIAAGFEAHEKKAE